MAEINEVIITRLVNSGGSITATFKPVIFKNFDDNLEINTNSTEAPLRTDRLLNYAGTYRSVSCQFVCPIQDDVKEMEKLMTMVYPEFTDQQDSGGQLTNQVSSEPVNTMTFQFGKFTAKPLLGTLKGLKYSYVNANTLGNVPREVGGIVIPRYIELSLDIQVAHTSLRGIKSGRLLGTLWR